MKFFSSKSLFPDKPKARTVGHCDADFRLSFRRRYLLTSTIPLWDLDPIANITNAKARLGKKLVSSPVVNVGRLTLQLVDHIFQWSIQTVPPGQGGFASGDFLVFSSNG